MFVVMAVKKKLGVEVMGAQIEVDLCYAEGMIGGLPVFDTRENAEAWADGKPEVIEVECV